MYSSKTLAVIRSFSSLQPSLPENNPLIVIDCYYLLNCGWRFVFIAGLSVKQATFAFC